MGGRKIMKVFFILNIILFFFNEYSYANPIIKGLSGDIRNNNSVTIYGTGFGIKSKADPILWDTIDNQRIYSGLNDFDVVPVGASYVNKYNEGGKYTTSRTHRPFRSAHYYGTGGRTKIGDPTAMPTGYDSLYVSWYYRPSINPTTSEIPDGSNGSNKFIRIWDVRDGTGTRISWTQMHLTDNGGGPSWGKWSGNVGQWNRHEIWVDSKNNRIKAWVNAKLLHNISNFVKYPSTSDGLKPLGIGWESNVQSYPSMITEFTDVYIDNTQARVEIGNSSTWNECTIKEIQIPSDWDSSAITVSLNLSSFTKGGTVYIYVIDANGIVNTNGYPVSVNSDYIEKSPSSPSKLFIKS